MVARTSREEGRLSAVQRQHFSLRAAYVALFVLRPVGIAVQAARSAVSLPYHIADDASMDDQIRRLQGDYAISRACLQARTVILAPMRRLSC